MQKSNFCFKYWKIQSLNSLCFFKVSFQKNLVSRFGLTNFKFVSLDKCWEGGDFFSFLKIKIEFFSLENRIIDKFCLTEIQNIREEEISDGLGT